MKLSDTLLLISEKPEDREFSDGAASAMGLSLVHAQSKADVVRWLEQAERSPILVDASDSVSSQIYLDAMHELHQKSPQKVFNPDHLHLIHTCDMVDLPGYFPQDLLFGSFISRSFKKPGLEGAHFGSVIKGCLSESGLQLKNLFASSPVVEETLVHSSDKHPALDRFKALLESTGFPERASNVMITALDEVLMNAIYDAVEDSRSEHIEIPRSTPIPLEGKAQVSLSYGVQNDIVGVSVSDNFGSLKRTKLLRHLSKSYSKENYTYNQDSFRAGLGIGAIFKSGATLVFSYHPQVRTQVTLFYKKAGSFLEFRGQFKFVSVLDVSRT